MSKFENEKKSNAIRPAEGEKTVNGSQVPPSALNNEQFSFSSTGEQSSVPVDIDLGSEEVKSFQEQVPRKADGSPAYNVVGLKSSSLVSDSPGKLAVGEKAAEPDVEPAKAAALANKVSGGAATPTELLIKRSEERSLKESGLASKVSQKLAEEKAKAEQANKDAQVNQIKEKEKYIRSNDPLSLSEEALAKKIADYKALVAKIEKLDQRNEQEYNLMAQTIYNTGQKISDELKKLGYNDSDLKKNIENYLNKNREVEVHHDNANVANGFLEDAEHNFLPEIPAEEALTKFNNSVQGLFWRSNTNRHLANDISLLAEIDKDSPIFSTKDAAFVSPRLYSLNSVFGVRSVHDLIRLPLEHFNAYREAAVDSVRSFAGDDKALSLDSSLDRIAKFRDAYETARIIGSNFKTEIDEKNRVNGIAQPRYKDPDLSGLDPSAEDYNQRVAALRASSLSDYNNLVSSLRNTYNNRVAALRGAYANSLNNLPEALRNALSGILSAKPSNLSGSLADAIKASEAENAPSGSLLNHFLYLAQTSPELNRFLKALGTKADGMYDYDAAVRHFSNPNTPEAAEFFDSMSALSESPYAALRNVSKLLSNGITGYFGNKGGNAKQFNDFVKNDYDSIDLTNSENGLLDVIPSSHSDSYYKLHGIYPSEEKNGLTKNYKLNKTGLREAMDAVSQSYKEKISRSFPEIEQMYKDNPEVLKLIDEYRETLSALDELSHRIFLPDDSQYRGDPLGEALYDISELRDRLSQGEDSPENSFLIRYGIPQRLHALHYEYRPISCAYDAFLNEYYLPGSQNKINYDNALSALDKLESEINSLISIDKNFLVSPEIYDYHDFYNDTSYTHRFDEEAFAAREKLDKKLSDLESKLPPSLLSLLRERADFSKNLHRGYDRDVANYLNEHPQLGSPIMRLDSPELEARWQRLLSLMGDESLGNDIFRSVVFNNDSRYSPEKDITLSSLIGDREARTEDKNWRNLRSNSNTDSVYHGRLADDDVVSSKITGRIVREGLYQDDSLKEIPLDGDFSVSRPSEEESLRQEQEKFNQKLTNPPLVKGEGSYKYADLKAQTDEASKTISEENPEATVLVVPDVYDQDVLVRDNYHNALDSVHQMIRSRCSFLFSVPDNGMSRAENVKSRVKNLYRRSRLDAHAKSLADFIYDNIIDPIEQYIIENGRLPDYRTEKSVAEYLHDHLESSFGTARFAFAGVNFADVSKKLAKDAIKYCNMSFRKSAIVRSNRERYDALADECQRQGLQLCSLGNGKLYIVSPDGRPLNYTFDARFRTGDSASPVSSKSETVESFPAANSDLFYRQCKSNLPPLLGSSSGVSYSDSYTHPDFVKIGEGLSKEKKNYVESRTSLIGLSYGDKRGYKGGEGYDIAVPFDSVSHENVSGDRIKTERMPYAVFDYINGGFKHFDVDGKEVVPLVDSDGNYIRVNGKFVSVDGKPLKLSQNLSQFVTYVSDEQYADNAARRSYLDSVFGTNREANSPKQIPLQFKDGKFVVPEAKSIVSLPVSDKPSLPSFKNSVEVSTSDPLLNASTMRDEKASDVPRPEGSANFQFRFDGRLYTCYVGRNFLKPVNPTVEGSIPLVNSYLEVPKNVFTEEEGKSIPGNSLTVPLCMYAKNSDGTTSWLRPEIASETLSKAVSKKPGYLYYMFAKGLEFATPPNNGYVPKLDGERLYNALFANPNFASDTDVQAVLSEYEKPSEQVNPNTIEQFVRRLAEVKGVNFDDILAAVGKDVQDSSPIRESESGDEEIKKFQDYRDVLEAGGANKDEASEIIDMLEDFGSAFGELSKGGFHELFSSEFSDVPSYAFNPEFSVGQSRPMQMYNLMRFVSSIPGNLVRGYFPSHLKYSKGEALPEALQTSRLSHMLQDIAAHINFDPNAQKSRFALDDNALAYYNDILSGKSPNMAPLTAETQYYEHSPNSTRGYKYLAPFFRHLFETQLSNSGITVDEIINRAYEIQREFPNASNIEAVQAAFSSLMAKPFENVLNEIYSIRDNSGKDDNNWYESTHILNLPSSIPLQ